MTLRDGIRALRMFARSHRLYRDTLRDGARAWRLLFSSSAVRFRARSGAEVSVPSIYWTMLPTVCRLLRDGATPAWEGEMLKVAYGELVLYAPPLDKSIGWTLREIFIDDAYGVSGLDLTGQTVLDVGAYIGDSTVAFALRGARVHAFEPVPLLQAYLSKNVAANGLSERVTVHGVGLSDRDEVLSVAVNLAGLAGATVQPVDRRPRTRADLRVQELKMVDANDYLARQGIVSADIVKLDCEGCEYRLLRDGALIESLRPRRLMMEYHRGGAPLYETLLRHGYRVNWPQRDGPMGYMDAIRETAT